MSDHFDKIKMIAPRWFTRDKRATRLEAEHHAALGIARIHS
jgi:hypothetical protein